LGEEPRIERRLAILKVSGKIRHAGQRRVKFEISRLRLQCVDSLNKLWIELRLADQVEKRAFGVGIGNDHAASNFRSVPQRDTDGGAVLDENAFHRRAGLQG